ncbi:MAG: ABC transporter ATP-binding protein [Gammaproteobacteria bacterium]|nr:ABC transporter ATP-binding protein [Gammaproteobacteria bacterium]
MNDVLLSIEHLSVRFAVGRRLGKKRYLYAVDDVSFDVNRGDTLGIVGESGSGKTTAALAIARLLTAYEGSVEFKGQNLLKLNANELKAVRRQIQFMFQDPYSSLNPRLRAGRVVREPLDHLTDDTKASREATVAHLFEQVGLRPEQQALFPHQFSGGQRQRLGIARALATKPELLICDEPVSALDVAVQSQILNLLRRLQTELHLTMLFISHDLGVVQYVCNRIAVMYMGKVVELADRKHLFSTPQHPYTQALLSAVPSINKRQQPAQKIVLTGDPADAIDRPIGCRFAGRCPVAEDLCHREEPKLASYQDGQRVACHRVSPGQPSPLTLTQEPP